MKKSELRQIIREELGESNNYMLRESAITENRWLDIKNDEASPRAKLGVGIRSIKNQLSEIETFLNWYSKIKTENNLQPEDYWKRTTKNLHRIRERLMNISEKIRKL